ncbi:MAG: glycosyltransferase family 4 protein [Anaerolineae bacterium]|nr:glycosyltransferase family 4 protein [Anaerolineae bacterium]
MMNVGIVSTRLAGLDGVSLEVKKWAHLLRQQGHDVFFCAGELGPEFQPGLLVEAMYYLRAANLALHARAFSAGQDRIDRLDVHQRLEYAAAHLRGALEAFLRFYAIDLLITQNAQAIPVQIPLGMALRDVIAQTGIPTIGHHHDLYWERERFQVNQVDDLLRACFPSADLPNMQHVVINTHIQQELKARTGLNSTFVPNVFDFATPPPGLDDYNVDFRAAIGLNADDIIFLQATRIIRRKAIERSIELVQQLADPRIVLVLTGGSGDETDPYEDYLRGLIAETGIRALFIRDHLAEERQEINGRKVYALWDAYVHADFVTYPSEYEGFGNGLIETLYFKKPLLVNRYRVYDADIRPTGIDAIEIAGEVTPEAVQAVRALLADPARQQTMVEHNYEIGLRHFSYEVLDRLIREIVAAALA